MTQLCWKGRCSRPRWTASPWARLIRLTFSPQRRPSAQASTPSTLMGCRSWLIPTWRWSATPLLRKPSASTGRSGRHSYGRPRKRKSTRRKKKCLGRQRLRGRSQMRGEPRLAKTATIEPRAHTDLALPPALSLYLLLSCSTWDVFSTLPIFIPALVAPCVLLPTTAGRLVYVGGRLPASIEQSRASQSLRAECTLIVCWAYVSSWENPSLVLLWLLLTEVPWVSRQISALAYLRDLHVCDFSGMELVKRGTQHIWCSKVNSGPWHRSEGSMKGTCPPIFFAECLAVGRNIGVTHVLLLHASRQDKLMKKSGQHPFDPS